MKTKINFPGLLLISCCLLAVCSCEKRQKYEQTQFSKADSLTETYLALQDSMLQAWNIMIHDDNRKIKAMQHLVQEMMISYPEKKEALSMNEARLDDLVTSRYDANSMSDPQLVSEYDFASGSLVNELISLAESAKGFAFNTKLQKLVDEIRAADQRVNNYRNAYDRFAGEYNRFIERNRSMLKEIARDSSLETKPLFQMAAE